MVIFLYKYSGLKMGQSLKNMDTESVIKKKWDKIWENHGNPYGIVWK